MKLIISLQNGETSIISLEVIEEISFKDSEVIIFTVFGNIETRHLSQIRSMVIA